MLILDQDDSGFPSEFSNLPMPALLRHRRKASDTGTLAYILLTDVVTALKKIAFEQNTFKCGSKLAAERTSKSFIANTKEAKKF